jgi:hypothetical protein
MLHAGRSQVRFPTYEVIGLVFVSLPNFSSRTMALGLTPPLTEVNTKNLPGGRGVKRCRHHVKHISVYLSRLVGRPGFGPRNIETGSEVQGGLFLPVIRRYERKADRALPPSAEVTNNVGVPPFPLTSS